MKGSCLQARRETPRRPADPVPRRAIALGIVLLTLGVGLLLHGARHLAGHIVRSDGAVRKPPAASLLPDFSLCESHACCGGVLSE